MPDPYERHGRPGSWDWDSGGPSRSQARAAAVQADAGEARRAPGRKDRAAACKGNHGGPHVPRVVFVARAWHKPGGACAWMPGWSTRQRKFTALWACYHQEHCGLCGRHFRDRVELSECEHYPGDPGQRAETEAKAADWGQRSRSSPGVVARRKARQAQMGVSGFRRRRNGG